MTKAPGHAHYAKLQSWQTQGRITSPEGHVFRDEMLAILAACPLQSGGTILSQPPSFVAFPAIAHGS